MSCNASDIVGATVTVVECGDCCFAWQFPVHHTKDDSCGWFDHAYRDGGATKSDYFSEESIAARTSLQTAFLQEVVGQPGSLLDVGAGTGRFAVAAAAAGWKAAAVDPAIDVDTLAGLSAVHAVRGDLEDLPARLQYDVVTAWDVVEHVEHPPRFIDAIAARLRSGGWCILETGNYLSTSRVVDGRDWGMYQRDHRWYFSPGTLSRLMVEAGFDDIMIGNRVLRPGWTGTAASVGPSWGRTLRQAVRRPWRAVRAVRRHLREHSTRGWPHGNLWVFVLAAKKR